MYFQFKLDIFSFVPIIQRNNTPPAIRKITALRGVNFFYNTKKSYIIQFSEDSLSFEQQLEHLIERGLHVVSLRELPLI